MTHSKDSKLVNELFAKVDGSGSDKSWAAIRELKQILGTEFAQEALRRFSTEKRWNFRAALIYHCIAFSKFDAHAFQIGLSGIFDRSKAVRFRASMLLAVSQNRGALKKLEEAKKKLPETESGDLVAAMDAITNKNQHFFLDRDHSGKTFLEY